MSLYFHLAGRKHADIPLSLECGVLDLSVPRKLTCIYGVLWLLHGQTLATYIDAYI